MLTTKISWSQLIELAKKELKIHSRYTFWRITSIIVMGFLGLSTLFTVSFIYNNIYDTITNSAIILSLNNEMPEDMLDLQLFETAQNLVKKKKITTTIPSDMRNIFLYGTGAATSTSNIKK